MIERVSFSQLSRYLMCGEQYRRSYIMKEWLPPNVSMIRGRAVHYAEEINARNIIMNNPPLDTQAAVELAKQYWEKERLEVAWRDFETQGYVEDKKKEFEKERLALISAYNKEVKAMEKDYAKVVKSTLAKHVKDLKAKGLTEEEKKAFQENHALELKSLEADYNQALEKAKNENDEAHIKQYEKHVQELEKLNNVEYVVECLEKETKRQIVRLTTVYHEAFGNIKPLYAEKKFEVNIGGHYPTIRGVFDLIEEGGIIVDAKTASKTPQENDIDEDFQMSLYDLSYRFLYGEKPKQLVKRWVIDKKEPETIEQSCDPRSDKHIKRVVKRIKMAMECIAKSVFLPAPQGTWWCSEKWCGYWEDCGLKP